MSTSLSASENTSPTSPVRLSGHDTTPQHVHSSSSTKPEEITSVGLDPSDQSTNSTVNGRSEEHSTQNNTSQEHPEDVLLLDSATSTPRLPPSKHGSDDLQLMPSHELACLHGSTTTAVAAAPHSLPPNNPRPSPSPRSPKNALVTSFSEINLSTSATFRNLLNQGLQHADKGSMLDGVASPPHSGKYSTNNTVGPSHIPVRTRSQGAMTDTDLTKPLALGGNKQGEASGGRERSAELADDSGREQNRNRSSSRSGGVEKRIEATLAKAEPGTTARSRKSSHLLGLFKENAVQDPRKLPERVASPRVNELKEEKEALAAPPSAGKPHPEERGFRPGLQDHVDHRDQLENERKVERATGHQDRRESGKNIEPAAQHAPDSSMPSTTHDDQQDGLQHHGLTIPSGPKPEPRKTQQSQQRPVLPGHAVVSVKEEAHTSKVPEPEATADQRRPEPIAEAEAEAEEDSDKEEISSALYYPHQAPSPNALDDRKAVQAATPENLDQIDLGRPAGSDFNAEDDLETPSEEVDISLQSQNKQRYLHGDLPKTRLPYDDALTLDSGLSSASESDYESLEESGRSTSGDEPNSLADAELTPKASPGTVPPFLKSKPRKGLVRSAAPFGAVELKPYTHQVGGHSTVYKFSKRAVCKPLSNRENEFYEVIESQHPELLKFLPR